ncbi:hypothetical protein VTH06DRAFT_7917 [Thermothelomyces fergusii]
MQTRGGEEGRKAGGVGWIDLGPAGSARTTLQAQDGGWQAAQATCPFALALVQQCVDQTVQKYKAPREEEEEEEEEEDEDEASGYERKRARTSGADKSERNPFSSKSK